MEKDWSAADMLIFDADQVKKLLDWQGTITAIETLFSQSCTVPERLHYQIPLDAQQDAIPSFPL